MALPTDDGECQMCGGCGEVEVTYQDTHKDVTACPICLQADMGGRIERLTRRAEQAERERDALDAQLSAVLGHMGDGAVTDLRAMLDDASRERDALRAELVALIDAADALANAVNANMIDEAITKARQAAFINR